MAAETVGLAASIAGIVSLGLEVVGGIIKYVDAVENRQEELESVSQQSKALNAILVEVDSMLRSHGQPGAVHGAVALSMQLFQMELSRLQALHADLADSDPRNWTSRLDNKKKKVTYPFKRSKIQELGLRMQKAGDALQLTLNVLDLKVSRQHTDALAAVSLSFQDISSGVSSFRSEVAAIGLPIAKMNDQLYRVESSVDSKIQWLIARDEANQRKSDASLQSLQEQNGILLRNSREMMQMFQSMQKGHAGSLSSEAVVRGLAGKPSLLKETSGDLQPTGQSHEQLAEPDSYTRPSAKIFRPSIRHYLSAPIVERVCICPHLQIVTKSKRIKLGHAFLSSEREATSHWPACSMAKVNSTKRTTMSSRYNGLVRILNTAVEVSFAMTSGAGGFSISPKFNCIVTIDDNLDPAFRIIGLIGHGLWNLRHTKPEHFLIACLKRLDKLLKGGEVSATAVNSRNMSLMHYAILALSEAQVAYYDGSGNDSELICSLFVQLIQMLLAYGVAPFAFDLEGMSPLAKLEATLAFNYEMSQAVIDVLIRANSENQPLALDTTCIEDKYEDNEEYEAIPTIEVRSLYSLFSGFAEGCECGPLSIAVIQDDANRVEHMLNRTPGSIAEVDVFGQTAFHLAAANPSILEILLKYKDPSILDRRDISGFTAFEMAMIRTSDSCENGSYTNMCHVRDCECCLCIDLFIGAECDVRMHELTGAFRAPELFRFLSQASELARHKYVYYMGQRRTLAGEGLPSRPHASKMFDMSWVFLEIGNPHLGGLFYQHGFQPHPSFLNSLQRAPPNPNARPELNYDYLHWLLSHGVRPFFRSSRGPAVIKNSPKIGLFGAHYAFYLIHLSLERQTYCEPSRLYTGSWDTYMALTARIWREDLTDGCRCYCTTHGCSPFTWMMKGSVLTVSQIGDHDIGKLVSHYSHCGSELTLLTYKAAIRYATFGALGLVHTCCDACSLAYYGFEWVDRDDVDSVNEEQDLLLDLLEDLVREFEEKAVEFLKPDLSGHSLFPQFWSLCWKVRMEEELGKLDARKLTNAERRAAEEIGVRWTVSQQEGLAEQGNPYRQTDPEYWFYELDEICPEYAEPWPEELYRVSELP